MSAWKCNAGGSTLASVSQKKMFVEDFLTQQHVNNEQMLRSRLARANLMLYNNAKD